MEKLGRILPAIARRQLTLVAADQRDVGPLLDEHDVGPLTPEEWKRWGARLLIAWREREGCDKGHCDYNVTPTRGEPFSVQARRPGPNACHGARPHVTREDGELRLRYGRCARYDRWIAHEHERKGSGGTSGRRNPFS